MNDKSIVEVTVGLPALEYTKDATAPNFVQFSSLSLDSGELNIVFDETVRMSTITYASIALHPSHDSTENFEFSGGDMVSQDATTVTFTMSEDDLNRLKKDELCVGTSACYIRMASSAFDDMAGNALVPVEVRDPSDFSLAERLKIHIDDTTDPKVTKFDLNLDDDTITLYFDETIRMPVIPGAITLQGSANAQDADKHTLLGGECETTEDGLVAVIKIDDVDSGIIAGVTNLARSDQDTYLTYSTALLKDMRQNPVQQRVNSGAGDEEPLKVTAFQGDRTPPSLIKFESMDFSVNPATMTLLFSEAVETSTLLLDKVFLIPKVDETTANFVKLSDSTVDYVYDTNGNTNKKQIIITLSRDDQRYVKLNYDLATDATNTFIALNFGAIKDKHGELSLAISPSDSVGAMQVEDNGFKPDVTQAVLESCNLDMNAGILTLVFNDVVDSSTMQATKIAIQSGL